MTPPDPRGATARPMRRLAVLDTGEPAVRLVAAVAARRRRTGAALSTVVVHDEPALLPWYAREADDVLALPPPPSGAGHDPADLVAAVRGTGADAVWIGRAPYADDADLVEAFERAGTTLLGPSSATLRALADPDVLARLAEKAGLAPTSADLGPERWRRLDVDVLADRAGTVQACGLRDVSVRRGDVLVLAESPPADVPPSLVEALLDAARRLARVADLRGAGVVSLALSLDGERFSLLGIDPVARPEHALVEETSGRSLLDERLSVACGGLLGPAPAAAEGHAVEARLLAADPEWHFRASGGPVRLLGLPSGTAVRFGTSLREGDVVDASREPLLAAVTAWGRRRDEAYDRLRGALERTVLVLGDGTSNRCALLALLADLGTSPPPVAAAWYAQRLRSEALRPAADPLALVAAAVEAYESDRAVAQAAFHASAARGRPAHPEAVGTSVSLRYRGASYRLRVDRTGERTYEVHGTATVEVLVDRLSAFERRIACGTRRHRVVAVEQGADIRLELDAAAHTVSREDGVVVRAGWPALVAALPVETGERVTVGQPVAVLESMKMVSTVASPVDGTVTSVAVLTNAQVERGAALLRITPSDGRAGGLPAAERNEEPVDLAELAPPLDDPGAADCRAVYGRLATYLLGYDLDPERFSRLLRAQAALPAASTADDPDLLACEDELLDLFADVAALYRRRGEADPAPGEGMDSAQEYFLSYLQWLDPDQAGLPDGYRDRLHAALLRYGVSSLRRTSELESATLWMFRSFERVPVMVPAITAILGRRLAALDVLAPSADGTTRHRLERLLGATEGRQQPVADLARDVLFHLFDEPPMIAALDEARASIGGHLEALRSEPADERRAEHVAALVSAPYPLRRSLLDAWLGAGEDGGATRAAVLEVYARRFYRIRDLHDVTAVSVDGVLLGRAEYEHEGQAVCLVVGYLPLLDLPAFSRSVAAALRAVPEDRALVLDVVTWREGSRPPIDELSDTVLDLLSRCTFGRPLHRLDVTMTSLGDPDTQGRGTEHLTFRTGPEGSFVEEPLYRNLHPMLAKRLELWRLGNFSIERLDSPEDVYLFAGVAKDNPKDRRLFALAEVRDLLLVRDEATGQATYPRIARAGLQALAAMRTALAQYPKGQRPAANRLVLWVRPPWTVPPDEWASLAAAFEPMARGAGLEKLVLHVHVPQRDDQGGTATVPKVLTLDGIGRTGLTLHYGDPGPNPIRPLTAYAQKVLTAERFGVPYPYEIVSMLTPGPDDASPFPPGDFEELDLGADGETLVPVDRPPAGNTAHVVVGLLTSYTEAVPEGMTRVALLSDPTQGFGNLAEPECRRVNAALALAAQRRLPVEWYAVSSGALIAMDSGTEHMDFISLTLRRIIEHTQAGGEINVVVTGLTVGGQPYWNAEATMLMHTKGILVMTPASAMVLTGKQALDFSGAVSADDNFGIGGYDRVMGPNGQAQYWAPTFQDACRVLLSHYDYSYVVPGERFPRRRPTRDPVDRDIRTAPHDPVPGSSFTEVGEVFDPVRNPERKQPFDMRSVMRAVADTDCEPLERWKDWHDAENAIVWDVRVGGIPVCMLGISSRTLPRKGFVPADGPPAFTSGTLFPQASRKAARAINATSGRRPLVVMANLSGFDGSPESMRKWQLEYGAEIGRAVTNFAGPLVFVVVSRYHGGAFVVFSKALNASMESAAIEGSYASVIGGAPAAATVFARDVAQRTEKDLRVREARAQAAAASGPEAGRLRAEAAAVVETVRSEKLREVADEFDSIHTIERALRTGSVDRIVRAEQVRPWVVGALERGLARADREG